MSPVSRAIAFARRKVLREPQQAAPGLISVPPCPPGFLVVRFRPSWYAEVDDEAYIGFVDAEALRQSGNPRFYFGQSPVLLMNTETMRVLTVQYAQVAQKKTTV